MKRYGKSTAAVRSRVYAVTALIACVCTAFWHDIKQIFGGMDIRVYHTGYIGLSAIRAGRRQASNMYDATGRLRCCTDSMNTRYSEEKQRFFLSESTLFQNISRIEDECNQYKVDNATKIDLIFVISSKDLPQRRKHMERLLESMNAQQRYVFADEISQSFVAEKNALGYFSEDDMERHKMIVNASFRSDASLAKIHSVQVLNPGEKSLSLAHYLIWEAIAYTPWIKTAMIFEDDVFPIRSGREDDILSTVDSYIESIESEYHQNDPWILYPGLGKGDTEKRSNFHNYKNNLLISKHHLSKYSDTYVMNRQAAIDMVRIMVPFSTTVDWQMSWGSKCCNITV